MSIRNATRKQRSILPEGHFCCSLSRHFLILTLYKKREMRYNIVMIV